MTWCRAAASIGLGPSTALRSLIRTRPPAPGPQSRALVQAVLQQNRARLDRCYQVGLKIDPRLRGQVDVRISIGSQGGVIAAVVTKTTLEAPVVERCLVQTITGLTFPPPPDGGVVVVEHSFRFSAGR